MRNFDLSHINNTHQHYQLSIIGSLCDSSVIKFVLQETLNSPFAYAIKFTSTDKDIHHNEELNNQTKFYFFERFDTTKIRSNEFGDAEINYEATRNVYE